MLGLFTLALSLGGASIARAQESQVETSMTPPPAVTTGVRDGLFLPSLLSPRVGAVPAHASGFGGYDSARGTAIANVTAEVRIWGPIALRGGAEYSPTRKEPRPTIGGRVQLLNQERHGVDGSLSVFYRPEGFTEPEGEIETFISVGRRVGRVMLLGNLVYGQDPEGNERDGEVRLGSLYSLSDRVTLGLETRLRFAIGPQKGTMAAAEPKLDFLAGPIVTATVGPLALFAEVGPSVFKATGSTSVGITGLGGLGTVF